MRRSAATWPLAYACYRAIARQRSLYADFASGAACAPDYLPIADADAFLRDVRTMHLLDVADLALSRRKSVDWWPHHVDVVGAWVQQVLPEFFLVIGAHCRPAGHRKSNVAHGLLEHETAAISQMVISQLFEEILAGAGGRGTLQAALAGSGSGVEASAAKLSSREMQIARLIGAGKQNKQVAYIAGISEFTVENHLRRIYRKLNVHNRAAMTAKIFGGH